MIVTYDGQNIFIVQANDFAFGISDEETNGIDTWRLSWLSAALPSAAAFSSGISELMSDNDFRFRFCSIPLPLATAPRFKVGCFT
jgi:hypothetical protein